MSKTTERWGDPDTGPKVSTIRRDFDALRQAVYAGDRDASLDAWRSCERWLPWVYEQALVNPDAPPPTQPA